MVGRDRVGDVLQQHRLAGARLRHDQRALALAERRHQIDDARRDVLAGRVVDLHLQPLRRIERRQIVEMDLVPDFFRIVEIDRVDLEQREIALALLRAADRPLDRIAGLQREAPDLRGRDVDVVGTRQIVGVGRAQEAETVLQHFDDAVADDLDVLAGELLQDREHQLLLAHDAGVLDLERFGVSDQLRRLLVLEFCEFHFLHGQTLGNNGGKCDRRYAMGRRRRPAARRRGGAGRGRKNRLLSARPRKEQGAIRPQTLAQNGFTITRITIAIINNVGISLTIRQWRAGFSLRSSAKRRTAADR